jgi:hypothetical protein
VWKEVWGLLFLLSLCVFGCISVVAEKGVWVRDWRVLGLRKVGVVGWLVGDEYEGGRDSLVTS